MSTLYEERHIPITFLVQNILTTVPHLHKEVEVIFVEEGEAEVFADRYHSTIHEGEIFISFPNQVHYYKNCTPGKYHVAIILPDVIYGADEIFRKDLPLDNVLPVAPVEEIRTCFHRAFDTMTEKNPTKLCGYTNLIMSHIVPKLKLSPLLRSDNATIRVILDFCNHNFASNPSLEDVANALHLSKYYISHTLNNRLGFRFTDYMNSLRINEACNQLKDTNKKIADISEDVGFGSIRSFNRVFVEFMELSPIEYRKKYSEDQSASK